MADNTKRILKLHAYLDRVMADERFADGRPKGPELRHLIVAYYWSRFEGGDKEDRWQRTLTLAGLQGPSRRFRVQEVFRADAPRYEQYDAWRFRQCPSLMTRGPRKGEPCGKEGTRSFHVTDPATGEWEARSWCYRHKVDADEEYDAERARKRAGFPIPLPNVGGLLPCYIRASNWPDLYTWASYRWTPPEIGIIADDWPVLAKVASKHMPKPQLHVLDGDGESSDGDVPALRLVT
jgi:hypothetical protein